MASRANAAYFGYKSANMCRKSCVLCTFPESHRMPNHGVHYLSHITNRTRNMHVEVPRILYVRLYTIAVAHCASFFRHSRTFSESPVAYQTCMLPHTSGATLFHAHILSCTHPFMHTSFHAHILSCTHHFMHTFFHAHIISCTRCFMHHLHNSPEASYTDPRKC